MDKELFGVFYKKNYKKALCFVVHNQIPKPYAEDLIQDIFLEVFTKYDEDYIKNPKLFFKLLKFRIASAKANFKRQIEVGTNLKRNYRENGQKSSEKRIY